MTASEAAEKQKPNRNVLYTRSDTGVWDSRCTDNVSYFKGELKRLYTCMWLCVSEHDVADAPRSSTSILLLEAYILHGWIL